VTELLKPRVEEYLGDQLIPIAAIFKSTVFLEPSPLHEHPLKRSDILKAPDLQNDQTD
jgi:hypothetical protein